MRNSCVSNRIHVIFATKGRFRALTPEIRDRLYPFMLATAKEFGIEVLSIGGVEDHVHLLIALPPSISLAEAMKKIKANTSRWLNETIGTNKFRWQEGYGAFSVGESAIAATKRYIELQREHHRERDFRAEFIQMIRQHGIDPASVPWIAEG